MPLIAWKGEIVKNKVYNWEENAYLKRGRFTLPRKLGNPAGRVAQVPEAILSCLICKCIIWANYVKINQQHISTDPK